MRGNIMVVYFAMGLFFILLYTAIHMTGSGTILDVKYEVVTTTTLPLCPGQQEFRGECFPEDWTSAEINSYWSAKESRDSQTNLFFLGAMVALFLGGCALWIWHNKTNKAEERKKCK